MVYKKVQFPKMIIYFKFDYYKAKKMKKIKLFISAPDMSSCLCAKVS